MIEHPQLKPYHLISQTVEHVEIIKVQTNLHMIHHRKALELEIAEIEQKHDRTPSAETIPHRTSKP